ncbi:MAG TPA: DUF3793 family protein [Geobacteraceae bacterium]
MASIFPPNPRTVSPASVHQHPASRFPDPLDCLGAHLLLEGAEVFSGVKPANLISLVNRPRPCGRNLHDLWLNHGRELAARLAPVRVTPLRNGERNLLLLCHDPHHLERHLAHSGIRALLAKAGYDVTGSASGLLDELCRRMATGASFPHEIGLFLGYPAKDVAAFMGMVNLPFACQGPWKIYGDPARSLCLAAACRRSRAAMGCTRARCSSPFDCLGHAGCERPLFLSAT